MLERIARRFGQLAPMPGVRLERFAARTFREGAGFAALRDARVALYWPHGLGDFVQLGTVLPLLEASNRYWVVRYGDDFTSLFEANALAQPMYSGIRTTRNAFGAAAKDFHLGIRHESIDGSVRTLALNEGLHAAFERERIDAVLWSDFPDPGSGRWAFPLHTKARHLASLLVSPERMRAFDLQSPLPAAVEFSVAAQVRDWVDARLGDVVAPPGRLCLFGGSGHTNARKDWNDAGELERFVSLLRATDERWRVLALATVPDVPGVARFDSVFGADDRPLLGELLRALLLRAELFVGVPAGPFHLAMAKRDLPTVGIWLAHNPFWYDEPSPRARHLVASSVRKMGLLRWPAPESLPKRFTHGYRFLERVAVTAADVIEAAREALAS